MHLPFVHANISLIDHLNENVSCVSVGRFVCTDRVDSHSFSYVWVRVDYKGIRISGGKQTAMQQLRFSPRLCAALLRA